MNWPLRIQEAQSRLRSAKRNNPNWLHSTPLPNGTHHCSGCSRDALHEQQAIIETVKYLHFSVHGLTVVQLSTRKTCTKCGNFSHYCGGPYQQVVPTWVAVQGPKVTLRYMRMRNDYGLD